MGKSLVPLLHGKLALTNASYMQYPRRADMMGRSTCLDAPCVMGYSVVTRLGSPPVEYRYTEWVDFNTLYYRGPDFASSKGVELYDHSVDPGENTNVIEEMPTVATELSKILRRGPPTGGGWGPWAH